MQKQVSKSPPSSSFVNLNKFDYESKSMFPLQNLEKIVITSLGISQDGKSGGVIFIESDVGSFVLKPTINAPSDFFYNQLALTLDLNVPVMTIINCYDAEFKKVVYEIQKHALPDQCLSSRLKKKLDCPFYQIMEYIPSITLAAMGPQKFQRFFDEQFYRQYTLGMGVGFDLAINNSDRFKFIWRSEGNINNILIQINTSVPQKGRNWLQRAKQRDNQSINFDNFAFIDHDGSMPDPSNIQAAANIQKYLQKVTNFQLNIVMYLRKQYTSLPPEFDKLSDFLTFFTKYKLEDHHKIAICQGIIYLTKKLIIAHENREIHKLYESIIRQTKQNSNRDEINYWNKYWNNQFTRRVSINFCDLYYIKVSAIYTTYPELINQIYERVDKTMKKWGQFRKKRKRVSLLGSLLPQKNGGSENGGDQRQSQGESNELEQNSYPNQDKIQESQQDAKKRRWREKLGKFKQQNYK